MRKAVREELDRIEQFLMRRDAASADLAAILTALRSSDDPDSISKDVLTVPIRQRAFPKIMEEILRDEEDVSTPRVGKRRYMAMGSFIKPTPTGADIYHFDDPDHFKEHVRLAIDAINATDEEER